MKLVNFSVTNFRSITNANNIPTTDLTILIGANNEGKSNLLNALVIAIGLIRIYSRPIVMKRLVQKEYNWERDFPIALQKKKPSGKTIFKLEFLLSDADIIEFKNEIKSSLNGTLPIEITIGNEHEVVFKVLKKGKGGTTLSKKARSINKFIGNKIHFTYIPAIRTAHTAVNVVENMVEEELSSLEDNIEYQEALKEIARLQQPILDSIANRIIKPLVEFIPQIKKVDVIISEEARIRALRRTCEIIIDDGTPTSIERKGDGVKSLAAISLLRGSKRQGETSFLALEEPESHLHPNAIHRLRDVINDLSKSHQVILTTHCPLFVDRLNLKSNILVKENKAIPAKKISEIRNLLGVKASDNLMHAKLVLIVEGENDKISLEAIFGLLSCSIKNALKQGTFVIDILNGGSNLSYKLSLLNQSLCGTHCLLDHDDCGREAIQKAELEGLITLKDYHLVICNGMTNSELEDCFNVDLYKDKILDIHGIDLNHTQFKNSNRWSERMRKTYYAQGKPWNDKICQEAKNIVASRVACNPEYALNSYKRTAIDSLIEALEEKLTQ